MRATGIRYAEAARFEAPRPVADRAEAEVFEAKSWSPAFPNTLLFDEAFGGYCGLLENTLDAVRGLVPLAAPGADGATAVALIEAIRMAIETGADIEFPSQGLAP